MWIEYITTTKNKVIFFEVGIAMILVWALPTTNDNHQQYYVFETQMFNDLNITVLHIAVQSFIANI